jgi:FtsP/CotA-like multicopper oxidase with cupredoxin domain
VRLERHRASVVAIDGQPAEPYEARNGRVVLAPGNRIDLVVDADLPAGAVANLFVDAGTGEVAIARCVYAEGAPARPAPRAASLRLPPNALPERMDFTGALKRDLSIGDDARAAAPWLETLDVRSGPQPAPVFVTKRGRTVTLGIANRSAVPQMIHPHGHAVRLLDRLDDGWKPFWLDTVLVMPGTTERIAFVADNPGQWALDCVSVEAKPSQRLAWFAVE